MKYEKLIEKINKVHGKLNKDEKVKKSLKAIGDVEFNINFTDLNESVIVSAKNSELLPLKKGKKKDAMLGGLNISSETLENILLGKVEAVKEEKSGKITAEGNFDFKKLSSLLPLLETHGRSVFKEVD
jgi:alkyl sulfatase BDS1-like metallo-beta-lactamase superfamily hydrolase